MRQLDLTLPEKKKYTLVLVAIFYIPAWLVSMIYINEQSNDIFLIILRELVVNIPLIGIIIFATRQFPKHQIKISNPKQEGQIALLYTIAYLLLLYALFPFIKYSLILGGIFFNFGFLWGFLVIIPLLFLMKRNYGFSSFGLTKQYLGKAIFLGMVAALLKDIPNYLFPSFFQNSTALAILRGELPPATLLLFPLALIFALLTGPFPEEFFFRATLQTRLSLLLKSQFLALVLAALFHGLWHLPLPGLEIIVEQGFLFTIATYIALLPTALVFGVLWLRTGNLAAPVIYHAWVVASGGLTMIRL